MNFRSFNFGSSKLVVIIATILVVGLVSSTILINTSDCDRSPLVPSTPFAIELQDASDSIDIVHTGEYVFNQSNTKRLEVVIKESGTKNVTFRHVLASEEKNSFPLGKNAAWNVNLSDRGAEEISKGDVIRLYHVGEDQEPPFCVRSDTTRSTLAKSVVGS